MKGRNLFQTGFAPFYAKKARTAAVVQEIFLKRNFTRPGSFPGRTKPTRKEGGILEQTEHYQLSQWDASDRILRTDFNSDNAKIDAALRALAEANPYQKIYSVETQTDAQQIDLDVSGIDFTQYHKIELFVDCPTMTSGYTLRVNDISASSYTYRPTSGGGSGDPVYRTSLANIVSRGYGVVLFYSPATTAQVGCVYMTTDGFSYSGYQILAPVTWSQLTTFNIIGGQLLPAGTKIQIYGVRK